MASHHRAEARLHPDLLDPRDAAHLQESPYPWTPEPPITVTRQGRAISIS